MVTKNEIFGIKTFLTKLSHNILSFNFKFENLNFEVDYKNRLEIMYDLNIKSKVDGVPLMWDYFNCKSRHILQDACEIVGLSWSVVLPKLRTLTIDGIEIQKYGGFIPQSFEDKIAKLIKEDKNNSIGSYFYCNGEKKILKLMFDVELSDVYLDDGVTSDISIYCNQIFVDDKPLENLNEDVLETIAGYVSEHDELRIIYDNIIWDEISEHLDLESCDLWGHTYTYLRNIGDYEVESYEYVGHSTFSSKLCDFISGN
jgi:hypothetical protein